MKKYKLNRIIAYIVLSISLVLNSCNFNFPEADQEQVFSTDIINHFETGTQRGTIRFNLSGSDNGPFQVVVYPQWIDIKTFEGKQVNGLCEIPFEFKNVNDFLDEGRAEGYVFIKLGDAGIFQISLSYGKDKNDQPPIDGQEPMYCSTAEIDFSTENQRSFYISNKGVVDKTWYIENIPSWLELSVTSGVLHDSETKDIFCTVNREGMAPGDYSQIIHLESNNPQLSHGILIKMSVPQTGTGNSASVKWIEGEVKDAYYSKTADKLFVLTQSPNRLLVKPAQADTFSSYNLDRIPNCIDVKANGKTLAIGYNQAYVDIWNAETLEREKLIETDCVPYDLVFGENGWCYLAPDEDQSVPFYSLNLETEITYRSSNSVAIYEKSFLKKYPGKPLVYITRPQLSPSALLIANIQDGVANDTLPNWHEEFGHQFWFTNDTSKIISGLRNIYRIPEYTTESTHGEEMSILGTMDIPRFSIQSLDYNKSQQCYYVVGSDYTWAAVNAKNIYQINEISYEAEKIYKVSAYPGTINRQNYPTMDVHYVFCNSQNTKLFAIKNVDYYLDTNMWAMEIIDLPFE